MSKAQPFDHLGQNLHIQYIKCSELKPYKNNARTHSPKQIEQISQSMKEFGWTNPIIVDQDYNIIAGHGRLEAARSLDKSRAYYLS